MSLVTPALLGGILLVGLPIALHLVMRRHPQRHSFPALRFVEKRRQTNQTRLQLRHLLLLLLRCGLIALLAIALARPTLQGSGKQSDASKPVAAALIFDNGLRMNYTHAGETRLEAAQQLADWLLNQLPRDTPVAILDRGSQFGAWSIDRAAAQLRASRLRTTPAARPLEELFSDAAQLLDDYPAHRQEIYVFTDLAAPSWSDRCLEVVGEQLASLADASLYCVDVGVDKPTNIGIAPLRLSGDVIPAGGRLAIETRITRTTDFLQEDAAPTLSLWIQEEGKTELTKRGEQLASSGADTSPDSFRFVIEGLEEGTHQGYLQLGVNDPLPEDNRQFFTVEVDPPRQVLVVAASPKQAAFTRAALTPLPAVEGGLPPRVIANFKSFSELGATSLIDYDGIVLLDPPSLTTGIWNRLRDFVEAGGGLGVALGRAASGARQQWSQLPAVELLPAKLKWQSRDETFLNPQEFNHPLLRSLADYAEMIPWSNFPVFKYWELNDLQPGALTVANYANGQAALVEKSLGAGRVVLLTTPVSDLPASQPWNLLPTASDPWPFVAIVSSLADYLSGIHEQRLNYQAGQTAYVRLAQNERATSYAVRLPDATPLKQTLPPTSQQIAISATSQIGNYRILAGGQSQRIDRGFSINPSPEISQLQRIDRQQLTSALGEENVHFASSTKEINIQVGIGRVGRELFPVLILGVVVLLAAEHFTANTFYR